MDWYWVHTTYDPETGWIISQTETYLGTSCNGCLPNTNEPQTTITPETEWDCMNGTAGSNDDEGEAIKYMNWKVADKPDNPNEFDGIRSVEYFKGKRVSSENQGGHFKFIRHFETICTFCHISEPYNVWVDEINEVKLINPQTASSRIAGHLNYKHRTYTEDNSRTFSFSEVFP